MLFQKKKRELQSQLSVLLFWCLFHNSLLWLIGQAEKHFTNKNGLYFIKSHNKIVLMKPTLVTNNCQLCDVRPHLLLRSCEGRQPGHIKNLLHCYRVCHGYKLRSNQAISLNHVFKMRTAKLGLASPNISNKCQLLRSCTSIHYTFILVYLRKNLLLRQRFRTFLSGVKKTN